MEEPPSGPFFVFMPPIFAVLLCCDISNGAKLVKFLIASAISRVFSMQALHLLLTQLALLFQANNCGGGFGKMESTTLFFDKVCPY